MPCSKLNRRAANQGIADSIPAARFDGPSASFRRAGLVLDSPAESNQSDDAIRNPVAPQHLKKSVFLHAVSQPVAGDAEEFGRLDLVVVCALQRLLEHRLFEVVEAAEREAVDR